jgi:hypothetical protein
MDVVQEELWDSEIIWNVWWWDWVAEYGHQEEEGKKFRRM